MVVQRRRRRVKPSRRYKAGSRNRRIKRLGGVTTRRPRSFPYASIVPRRIPRTPFPNGKLMQHRYCDRVVLPAGAAAGLVSLYNFRSDSTYDPDYTGTGHQPLFRDEMAAVYTHYTVLRSTIKVIFPNQNTYVQLCGVYADDAISSISGETISPIMEKHKYSLRTSPSKAVSPYVAYGYYNAAKWNKTTTAGILADDNYRTAVGSNPSTGHYFTIWRVPVDPSDTLDACQVCVEIIYTVMWREPGSPIPS